MDVLAVFLIGGSITALTQLLKRFFPVNGLVVAAVVSALGGLAYASLSVFGYWESIRAFVLVAWPASVTIYQVITQAVKAFQGPQ